MTTIVQQIDTQGPVVVERISTQFADIACSEENVRKLIEGLRSGAAVTFTDSSGKTATFTPTGANFGYGETYIALALAAEALRSAGVTGCATADQWKAVLLGGPLTAAGGTSTATTTTSTATSSSHFPGILKLHSQGQGWGQIAQQTNVQLGQVVSSARSSLNIESGTSGLSPTGRSSAEMNQSRSTSTTPTTSGSTSTTPTTSGTTSTTPTTSGTTDTTPDSTPSSTSTGDRPSKDDEDKPGQRKAKGHDKDTPGHSKGHDRDSTSSSSSSSDPNRPGR